MKRLLGLFVVLVVSCIVFTGCEKSEEVKKEEVLSPAYSLLKVFESEIKDNKDLEVIANDLSKDKSLLTEMVVEKRSKKDYLSGFNSEIKGFDNAYVIQPMIGSIPFIAYVFSSSDSEKLEQTLKENANPRWNICVEADEVVVKRIDNYVFFCMAPKSFEE